MDDETSWQDAAPHDETELIGPVWPPDAAPPSPEHPAHGAAAPSDEEYDELESGIASIFAALQAANAEDAAGERDAAADEGDENDDSFAEAHTFQLLSELDRLWHRPGP